MLKNPIQFQKGLGLHEFLEKYGTESNAGKRCIHCAGLQDMFVLNVATPRVVNSKIARYTSVTNVITRPPCLPEAYFMAPNCL